MIPTLTAHIYMLATVLRMPLNILQDVAVRLHGISSLVLSLLLASFSLLLLLAALGLGHHHQTFPPSRGVR
jgi:hypothetical protein